MPADMGGKSPLRDGRNEESILAEIKQISSLLQFKTCAPALAFLSGRYLKSLCLEMMEPAWGSQK
jgi:hypothetical protein